jgi:cytochrome c peroxidase
MTSVALYARLQPAAVRTYVTQASEKKRGGNKLVWIVSGLVGIAAGYYIFSSDQTGKKPSSKGIDYQQVYNQIADILEDSDWDDGSWGPIFIRLGWHAAGTYDKKTGTGGSNGATMRFSPEADHAANAGLKAARDKLEPIKAKNPGVSYSDLWSLAAVCAIQEMVTFSLQQHPFW